MHDEHFHNPIWFFFFFKEAFLICCNREIRIVCFPMHCSDIIMGSTCSHKIWIIFRNTIWIWNASLLLSSSFLKCPVPSQEYGSYYLIHVVRFHVCFIIVCFCCTWVFCCLCIIHLLLMGFPGFVARICFLSIDLWLLKSGILLFLSVRTAILYLVSLATLKRCNTTIDFPLLVFVKFALFKNIYRIYLCCKAILRMSKVLSCPVL